MHLSLFEQHTQLQIVADLNLVSAFIAEDDFAGLPPDAASLQRTLGSPLADVLVLLGNSVLHTAEQACVAFREGMARHLLIAGGRGHSTYLLYENLRADPRYHAIDTRGRSEAELLAEIAMRFYGIDETLLTTETESSNCGENAQFARRTLDQTGIPSDTILLVQDPTMQRRSAATFTKVWNDVGRSLTVANYPTFVPQVTLVDDSLVFANAQVKGLWPMERFLSLVLGEIPRMRDDENGYGPQGRGFIEHVDIAPHVVAAQARLSAHFPILVR